MFSCLSLSSFPQPLLLPPHLVRLVQMLVGTVLQDGRRRAQAGEQRARRQRRVVVRGRRRRAAPALALARRPWVAAQQGQVGPRLDGGIVERVQPVEEGGPVVEVALCGVWGGWWVSGGDPRRTRRDEWARCVFFLFLPPAFSPTFSNVHANSSNTSARPTSGAATTASTTALTASGCGEKGKGRKGRPPSQNRFLAPTRVAPPPIERSTRMEVVPSGEAGGACARGVPMSGRQRSTHTRKKAPCHAASSRLPSERTQWFGTISSTHPSTAKPRTVSTPRRVLARMVCCGCSLSPLLSPGATRLPSREHGRTKGDGRA